MDIMQRNGGYPLPPGAPDILGVEFSGTIAELGDGAGEKWKVGDEVIGLALGVRLPSSLNLTCCAISPGLIVRWCSPGCLCRVHPPACGKRDG